MGRHEIGENGVSYSIAKRMENDADRAELDLKSKLLIIHRKCVRFVLHNGTHVGSMVVLHVIAVSVYYNLPAFIVGASSH